MIESLRAFWMVACTSDELQDKPLARTVLGVPVALFRAAGQASALIDRCPHRNAALSEGRVVGQWLQCPYHGWAFDGSGACRSIPGRPTREGDSFPHQHAATVGVAEQYGLVWVFVGTGPRPPLPEWKHPAMIEAGFDRFTWAARADCEFVDGIENLLDACHPHFTHEGLVRISKQRRDVSVTVRRTRDMVEAVYVENRRAEGIIPRLMEGKRTASIGRFFPPSTAQLDYLGEAGSQFTLTSVFTPCDQKTVLIHSVISTPRKKWLPAFLKRAVLRAVFGRVLRQDQEALTSQQANIARFGRPEFTSTPLDVMRPHILYFLSHPDQETRSDHTSSLTMEL